MFHADTLAEIKPEMPASAGIFTSTNQQRLGRLIIKVLRVIRLREEEPTFSQQAHVLHQCRRHQQGKFQAVLVVLLKV